MIMRTSDLVVYDYGHQGSIKLSENDQPYSEMY